MAFAKIYHKVDDSASHEHVATMFYGVADSGVLPICEEICDRAFNLTQNVHDSWSRKVEGDQDANDAITVVKALVKHFGVLYGHRSTSVGGRIELGTMTYECAPIGWKLI